MKTHNHLWRKGLVAACIVAGAIGLRGCATEPSTSVSKVTKASGGPGLSGAIFTTVVDGSVVNENVRYEDKREVYLDGGPGPNAPQHAAGLPDGNYYFQVTDPSGKDLLSTDSILCREIRVEGGIIVEYVSAGESLNVAKVSGVWTYVPCQGEYIGDAYGLWEYHNVGLDLDHGAATIQLYPFDDTPNPGGVYKVWITPVDEYVGTLPDACIGEHGSCNVNGEDDSPGNRHGFIPAHSKTDNFKVKRQGKPFLAPEIRVRKFHDPNLNGVQDPGEEDIVGWEVTLAEPGSLLSTLFTPELVVAGMEGVYVFTEATPAGTLQTVSLLDGGLVSLYPWADPTVSVDVAFVSGEQHEVVFGNVAMGSITACKYFDQNRDGEISGPLEIGVEGWRFRLDPGAVVQTTGEGGCTVFADLMPGTYTVTELFPLGDAWESSDGVTSSTHEIVSYLDGTELTGTAASASFANVCTVGGIGFGTKGYWHNKNGLTELNQSDIDFANTLAPYASPSVYFGACDEPFDGMCDGGPIPAPEGAIGEVAPEGSAKAEVSAFLVDANASGGGNGGEQLAQQLLAFIFNARNRLGSLDDVILLPGGESRSAQELIDAAVAAWLSGDPVEILLIQSVITSLNEKSCAPVFDGFAYIEAPESTCIQIIPAEPCAVAY